MIIITELYNQLIQNFLDMAIYSTDTVSWEFVQCRENYFLNHPQILEFFFYQLQNKNIILFFKIKKIKKIIMPGKKKSD